MSENVEKKADTPSVIVETHFKAFAENDIDTLKKLLSKSSLEYLGGLAETAKLTIDELFQQTIVAFQPLGLTTIQVLGEEIEGDTAIIEFNRVGSDKVEKTNLIKENNEWKVSLYQN